MFFKKLGGDGNVYSYFFLRSQCSKVGRYYHPPRRVKGATGLITVTVFASPPPSPAPHAYLILKL